MFKNIIIKGWDPPPREKTETQQAYALAMEQKFEAYTQPLLQTIAHLKNLFFVSYSWSAGAVIVHGMQEEDFEQVSGHELVENMEEVSPIVSEGD